MKATFIAEISSAAGSELRLTMYGTPDQCCEIFVDTDIPEAEDAFREWLETEATGMYGHGIYSGDRARPSDVLAALLSRGGRARWQTRIVESAPHQPAPPTPEGVVS
jgi:hypothetical protein